jgi:hypothetical protein
MDEDRVPVTEAPLDRVAVVVLDGVNVGDAVVLEEGVCAAEFVVVIVTVVLTVIVLLGV